MGRSQCRPPVPGVDTKDSLRATSDPSGGESNIGGGLDGVLVRVREAFVEGDVVRFSSSALCLLALRLSFRSLSRRFECRVLPRSCSSSPSSSRRFERSADRRGLELVPLPLLRPRPLGGLAREAFEEGLPSIAGMARATMAGPGVPPEPPEGSVVVFEYDSPVSSPPFGLALNQLSAIVSNGRA